LKQGEALSPLILIFAIENAIMKVLENHMGLKLGGAHQFLICADGVNLLGAIKSNGEGVLDARQEIDLEVNREIVLMSCHQSAGQNHKMELTNRSFENIVTCTP
jgi:hypothetical protein